MQITLYRIDRTHNNYQADKVPVNVFFEQGYLDPYILSNITRLVTDETTVLKGFLVGQVDDRSLVITRGLAVADRRLVVLEKTLTVDISGLNTDAFVPGQLYYVTLHIDTSITVPGNYTDNCIQLDRGPFEVLLTDTRIVGGTDDKIHIYVPVFVVRYLGNGVFRLEPEKSYSLRYVYPNYSLPYITTIVRTYEPSYVYSRATLNKYRYILSGFGIYYDYSRQKIHIDSGAVYLHGFVQTIEPITIDVLELMVKLYEYESKTNNKQITNPNILIGNTYVLYYKFDYDYQFVDYSVAYVDDILDPYTLDNYFVVPIATVNYLPGIGVTVKPITP